MRDDGRVKELGAAKKYRSVRVRAAEAAMIDEMRQGTEASIEAETNRAIRTAYAVFEKGQKKGRSKK